MSINENIKLVASKRNWEETKSKSHQHLIKNIKKFEFSTLYTQNYIANLEEVNSQLLVCFIIYCIIRIRFCVLSLMRWRFSLFTYKINSKFAEITSWAYRLLFRLHFLDIKSSTRSFSQLSLQFQIFRINLQTSSSSRYLYSYQKFEESKIIRESILYASFIVALRFLISNISKWRISTFNCKYLCSCFNARFRIEIRKRFRLFFCVLITNEHRMHA